MQPLLLGALAGLGALLVISALVPVRPHLLAAIDRLGTTTTAPPAEHLGISHTVGSWVQRRLPGLTPPTRDLELAEISTAKFYWDKALLAATGLLAPTLVGLLLSALGMMPLWAPPLVGVGLAIAMWFLPDLELKTSADNARAEYSRAVAIYLELVAAERRRNAPATHALLSAAEVSDSRVFRRIRQDLARAQLAGTPAWDSLAKLAADLDVPELADVARIMRLSGEQGASVYETLRSRGRGLRVQLLAQSQAEANAASERMTLPMTALAFVFIAIVITPLILNMLLG